jgi:uncharacterized protein
MIASKEITGEILVETIDRIRDILGDELETLTVERAVIGIFFSGVKLSNGTGGICFTPIKEIPEAVCCPSSARAMPYSGKLGGEKVTAYINRLETGGPLQKALSIAVLNALSSSCWKKQAPEDYTLELGKDPVDEKEIPEDAKVVVIGALVPYIKMLKQKGNEFHILEMDPRTLKAEEMQYLCPPEKADMCLLSADIVIITGVTVLNGSLDGILRQMQKGAKAILVGPTVSMLPDAFFRRGIDVIGGIIVTDADKLLDILAEAGSGYHFYGKSAERLVINKQLHLAVV